MHHAEKGGARHTAGQASNHVRLEIDDECIPKTFVHESNALVIWGDISAFAEMGEHLDIAWKVLEGVSCLSLPEGGNGHNQ